MAYGAKKTTFGNRRSSIKSRQSAARAKTVAKSRGRLANKAVKRAYFRRRVTKKSNYVAISTLARQVKQLQFSRNGFKQWHHVHMDMLSSYPAGTPADVQVRTMRPLQARPYAFMVNNFTSNSPIYYGAVNPAVSTAPSFGVAGEYKVLLTNGPFDDNYNWNIKQGQDTVLNTHYLPVKSTMRFELQCLSQGPTQAPITVRFTMLKLKNNGVASITANLPTTLGAYRNMVDFEPTTRNHFNTSHYHTILADKWVKFGQTDVVKNNNRKFITMTYMNYSTKPLNPDISGSPAGQKIYSTIPTKDQVWMVISTDCVDSTRFQIRSEKWNTWRDAAGIGN